MSYVVIFLLIISGYIIGAPIYEESLKFRIVECVPGENDTLSTHIIEVTNVNDTCIRVNQSSSTGNEVYLYIAPSSESGVQIRITTENCSTPLPDLHLSLCNDYNETEYNYTQYLVTSGYNNETFDDLIENNSTAEANLYTGPTVYETLHHIDDDTNLITNSPLNKKNDDSSEEDNNITKSLSNNVETITKQNDKSTEEDDN